MPIRTVAILSPGDMGHAVGQALGARGVDVLTCLQGRSERTRELARRAAIRDVPSYQELVKQAELVLSLVVPAQALDLARQVAQALRATGTSPLYADCNAISPHKAQQINGIITAAGGRFVDVGVIGGPPSAREAPRFYCSGPHAHLLAALDGMGIKVHQIGDAVGRAAGLKMCYAALTKGSYALYLALLTVARILGVSDELYRELEASQAETLRRMKAQVPRLPVTARRWVGEMEEIGSTFREAGVTPQFHLAAAELYRLLGQTPMAEETPETFDATRTMEQTAVAFADFLLRQRAPAPGTPG